MSDSCWHWCSTSTTHGSHFLCQGRQELKYKLVIFSCYFRPAAKVSRPLIWQRCLWVIITSAPSVSSSSPLLLSASHSACARWGVAGAELGGRWTACVENSFAVLRSCIFSFPPIVKWHWAPAKQETVSCSRCGRGAGAAAGCVQRPPRAIPRKCLDIWRSLREEQEIPVKLA